MLACLLFMTIWRRRGGGREGKDSSFVLRKRSKKTFVFLVRVSGGRLARSCDEMRVFWRRKTCTKSSCGAAGFELITLPCLIGAVDCLPCLRLKARRAISRRHRLARAERG